MRRQEYIAVAVLVALVFAAWYFEHAKEQSRTEARTTEQAQQASQ